MSSRAVHHRVNERNLVTIAEAAARLGLRPWRVVEMIKAGRLEHFVLVDADALPTAPPT